MNYKETYKFLFKNRNYANQRITEPRFQVVLNYLEKNDISSLVDIGSGKGLLIKEIKNKYPKIEILSTDLEKFHDVNCNFKHIDLSKSINFDKQYDLVTCLDVIEHLKEPDSVNILQKLKPYGKTFIFTIANHSDIINNIEVHLTQRNMDFWKYEINKLYNINHYEEHYNGRLGIFILS